MVENILYLLAWLHCIEWIACSLASFLFAIYDIYDYYSGVLWGDSQSGMLTSLPRQDSMMNLTASLTDITDTQLFSELNNMPTTVEDLDFDLNVNTDAMLGGYPPATLNPSSSSRYTGGGSSSEMRDSISVDSAVGSSPSYVSIIYYSTAATVCYIG